MSDCILMLVQKRSSRQNIFMELESREEAIYSLVVYIWFTFPRLDMCEL